jgi:hypothetical protein
LVNSHQRSISFCNRIQFDHGAPFDYSTHFSILSPPFEIFHKRNKWEFKNNKKQRSSRQGCTAALPAGTSFLITASGGLFLGR